MKDKVKEIRVDTRVSKKTENEYKMLVIIFVDKNSREYVFEQYLDNERSYILESFT